MITGPDVSFYQDDNETPQQIDFEKMKAAGSEFVIIRAGQNKWVDSDFAYNWENAKLAGLPRGNYWFWDSRYEPGKQAELWMRTLGSDLGELPLFADFEESYKGNFSGWKNFKIFVERIKQLSGKETGIYTAYYYFRENVPTSQYDWFAQHPLWVANYETDKPKLPPAWKEWLFWQFTDSGDGRAYGVESFGIDLNYFKGDQVTFALRFNLPDPQKPIPEIPQPAPEKEIAHVLYKDGTWK